MTDLTQTDDLFFNRGGLDRGRIESIAGDALSGADDGELFLEYCQSESVSYDDGRVRSASFDTTQGFGLRAVCGDAAGYAHSSEVSEAAVQRAAQTVKAVRAGHNSTYADAPPQTNTGLYTEKNPLGEVAFEDKVALLSKIDRYLREKDPRVAQVMATFPVNGRPFK